MSLIKTWLHEQQRRKEMARAYFLLYQDDYDPAYVDIASIANDLEESTGLSCEDHIFFHDEDQITPYIAY